MDKLSSDKLIPDVAEHLSTLNGLSTVLMNDCAEPSDNEQKEQRNSISNINTRPPLPSGIQFPDASGHSRILLAAEQFLVPLETISAKLKGN
jgi:hypothetical protein